MKRRCIDPDCGKKYVTSKDNQRLKKECAPCVGDHGLCDPCFRDVCQMNYDQSYFVSMSEWCDGESHEW